MANALVNRRMNKATNRRCACCETLGAGNHSKKVCSERRLEINECTKSRAAKIGRACALIQVLSPEPRLLISIEWGYKNLVIHVHRNQGTLPEPFQAHCIRLPLLFRLPPLAPA
jgi:hypothetical protein